MYTFMRGFCFNCKLSPTNWHAEKYARPPEGRHFIIRTHSEVLPCCLFAFEQSEVISAPREGIHFKFNCEAKEEKA